MIAMNTSSFDESLAIKIGCVKVKEYELKLEEWKRNYIKYKAEEKRDG